MEHKCPNCSSHNVSRQFWSPLYQCSNCGFVGTGELFTKNPVGPIGLAEIVIICFLIGIILSMVLSILYNYVEKL